MKPESFAYWLQGFFELTDAKELTTEQVAIIKEHLQLVFKKETKLLNDKVDWNYNNTPSSLELNTSWSNQWGNKKGNLSADNLAFYALNQNASC